MKPKKTPPRGKRDVPANVRRALAKRKVSADSEALLNDLIEVWGGTRQLALDLHAEFNRAGAGGMTRQRILEMIQRLILTNTTHQIGQSSDPSDMTDEELDATVLHYVEKVQKNGTASGSEES